MPIPTIDDAIAHRGTGDLVYETLRKAILTGQIKAGERLVEAKAAKDLHVSITPVRQAFATLAGQGLLTVFPYKGTYVTIITKEYLRDVVTMREALELAVYRLCADSVSPQDIAALEELCRVSDGYNSAGDLYHAIKYDVLFHEYFFNKAARVLLLEIWRLLRSRIEFIQSYTKKDRDFYHETRPDSYIQLRHGRMIQALRDNDRDGYESALLEHLRTSGSYTRFPEESEVVYR